MLLNFQMLFLLRCNPFQKFNHCDLIIEPKELTNFSTFETNKTKMDAIFEIGYNEAKKSFQNLDI